MAAIQEFPLTVRFVRTGRETSATIKEWSITSAYMVATDAAEFTMYDEDTDNLRNLELQPVELELNGATQFIGRVDKTECGNDGTAVTCQCRDYIADLVECNIDPGFKVKLGDQLLKVMQQAMLPTGIDTVVADDDSLLMQTVRSGKKPRKGGGSGSKHKRRKSRGGVKLQDFKPEPGQGIYDFLNKIVAREGATIQPWTTRKTVLVAEPWYDQEPLYKISRSLNQTVSSSNNIEHGVASRDFSRFPTYTMIHGQTARGGKASAHTTKAFDLWVIAAGFRTEIRDILTDSTVSGRWLPGTIADTVRDDAALYRLLVHRDEIATDDDQVEGAMARAIAERLKDTLEYRCTLRGHVDPVSGAIYTVDTIIQVDDDVTNVHEALWIAERTLKYSPSGGATTDLVCWRPESFDLGAESS